jgi:methyl-accepting chemotaxis protein
MSQNPTTTSARMGMTCQQVDRGSGFGEFFRYHGWLSPGVRLFRSISFPKKAAWVAGAFLAPLAAMLFFLVRGGLEQVETAKTELVGVSYVRPLLALERASHDLLAAALLPQSELTDALSKVRTAFSAVQQQHAVSGRALGLDEPFAELGKLHEAILAKPRLADLAATVDAHAAYGQALAALLREVADGSTLALDPELDTYHLMNVAVLKGPREIQNLARMSGLAAAALELKSLPAHGRELLDRWMAVHGVLDEEVENSFKAVVEATPEVAKLVDMPRADELTLAFYDAITKNILGEQLAGDAANLRRMGNEAIEAQAALMAGLLQRLDDQLQARVERVRGLMVFQLALSAGFVIVAGYLMLAFYRVMMGGLREVSGHLEEITKGNLTTAPRPWGRDEAADLMVTLGEMQQTLRRIVGNVLQSSADVDRASNEIASASNDLSSRTEQAAASLQQTASSMEEIGATVKHTAGTVDGAMTIVRDNASAAAQGGEVIGLVVKTMQGIHASSNRIGEIIGVIDSIAFQTNILALNAAVEAARAGEQGRGFAVVASEVRALAGRSASAAREIKSLIGASIEQVESGNRIAAEAGSTIAAIVANASRIDSLMAEIATATREQTSGVGQVGAAVSDLDRATQQNAALVEQTAASATALSEQARALATEVGFFRLG